MKSTHRTGIVGGQPGEVAIGAGYPSTAPSRPRRFPHEWRCGPLSSMPASFWSAIPRPSAIRRRCGRWCPRVWTPSQGPSLALPARAASTAAHNPGAASAQDHDFRGVTHGGRADEIACRPCQDSTNRACCRKQVPPQAGGDVRLNVLKRRARVPEDILPLRDSFAAFRWP